MPGDDVGRDKSFAPPADRTAAQVVAAYEAACARSDEIVLAADGMNHLAAMPNPGEDVGDTLRTIFDSAAASGTTPLTASLALGQERLGN